MWDVIHKFHFLRPYWLLALVPMALVLWLYGRRRLKAGNWNRVCDSQLLPFLLIGQQQLRSTWATGVMWLCGVLAIVALAGPAWKELPQPVFRSQAALIIALDLSRSMDVADIKPDRLTRARHKVLDILHKRREGQTALIVYAAEPFVVTPLTEDNRTVATLVNDLTTDLMPYQGSHPEKAVRKALELFKQASAVNGHVLLVTDGVGSTDIDGAVQELVNDGYQLSVLAIGTEQGAPIKSSRGGFIKDEDGNIVIAKLDAGRLRQVANRGRGIYRQLTANDSDVDAILSAVSSSRLGDDFSKQDDSLKLHSDQWREEGPWLLLMLLPVIALAFRRGYLAVLAVVLLPLPQNSYAFDWSGLWKTPDQQAEQVFEQGDPKTAAQMFIDPQWKAAASYRAGDYDKAIKSLDGIQQPDALYNRGNALAKAGQLQQAIDVYNKALKMDPDNKDARYNRDLLKDYLKKQQQQGNNQQDNNQQNNDQQGNQGQDQQQQKGDQGKQDQQQAGNRGQQDKQQNQQGEESGDAKRQQGSDDNRQQQQDGQQQDDQQQEPSRQQAQAGEDKDQENNDKEKQAARQQNEDDSAESAENKTLSRSDDLSKDDSRTKQLMEQWLRRIPDDPGGLLRRKFRYQSQLDSRQAESEKKPW
ncbi:MAG: VWA domain-containing protein [Gammaproteobacteria bacterium]|jgi:Ca-activated chloride channel family protein